MSNNSPESVLKRAQESIKLGNKTSAFSELQSFLERPIYNISKTYNTIVELFIDLAIDLNKSSAISPAMHELRKLTVRNLDQTLVSHGLKHLIKAGKQEAASNRGVEKYSSDATFKEAAEKKLTDHFRTVLDVSRINPKLVDVYSLAMHEAMTHFVEHDRKSDFHNFADMLKLHFDLYSKRAEDEYTTSMRERFAMLRFMQLRVAVKLGCWQEAFKIIESIKSFATKDLDFSADVLIDFQEQVAQIFLASGNYLFHTYALLQEYLLVKAGNALGTAAERQQQLKTLATKIICGTIATYPFASPSETTTEAQQQEINAILEKTSKLANLLDYPLLTPSFVLSQVMFYITREDTMPEAFDYLSFISGDFSPFALLKKQQALVQCLEKEDAYAVYVEYIKKASLLRQIKKFSAFFVTITFAELERLTGFNEFDLESFLLMMVQGSHIVCSIDQLEGSVTFHRKDKTEEESLRQLKWTMINSPNVASPPLPQVSKEHFTSQIASERKGYLRRIGEIKKRLEDIEKAEQQKKEMEEAEIRRKKEEAEQKRIEENRKKEGERLRAKENEEKRKKEAEERAQRKKEEALAAKIAAKNKIFEQEIVARNYADRALREEEAKVFHKNYEDRVAKEKKEAKEAAAKLICEKKAVFEERSKVKATLIDKVDDKNKFVQSVLAKYQQRQNEVRKEWQEKVDSARAELLAEWRKKQEEEEKKRIEEEKRKKEEEIKRKEEEERKRIEQEEKEKLLYHPPAFVTNASKDQKEDTADNTELYVPKRPIESARGSSSETYVARRPAESARDNGSETYVPRRPAESARGSSSETYVARRPAESARGSSSETYVARRPAESARDNGSETYVARRPAESARDNGSETYVPRSFGGSDGARMGRSEYNGGDSRSSFGYRSGGSYGMSRDRRRYDDKGYGRDGYGRDGYGRDGYGRDSYGRNRASEKERPAERSTKPSRPQMEDDDGFKIVTRHKK